MKELFIMDKELAAAMASIVKESTRDDLKKAYYFNGNFYATNGKSMIKVENAFPGEYENMTDDEKAVKHSYSIEKNMLVYSGKETFTGDFDRVIPSAETLETKYTCYEMPEYSAKWDKDYETSIALSISATFGIGALNPLYCKNCLKLMAGGFMYIPESIVLPIVFKKGPVTFLQLTMQPRQFEKVAKV